MVQRKLNGAIPLDGFSINQALLGSSPGASKIQSNLPLIATLILSDFMANQYALQLLNAL